MKGLVLGLANRSRKGVAFPWPQVELRAMPSSSGSKPAVAPNLLLRKEAQCQDYDDLSDDSDSEETPVVPQTQSAVTETPVMEEKKEEVGDVRQYC